LKVVAAITRAELDRLGSPRRIGPSYVRAIKNVAAPFAGLGDKAGHGDECNPKNCLQNHVVVLQCKWRQRRAFNERGEREKS
jgi:hypothetical protein